MNSEMLYTLLYTEINLVAIVLVGIIGFKTNGLSKMVAQRNFALSIGAEVFFFLSDTIYVMGVNGLFPCGPAMIMFTKTVYFFSTTLMCYFWFIYFELMQESSFVEDRRRMQLASIPIYIMAGLLLVNVFTGILFYVDDAGVYRRGTFFIVQYILSYTYVFITCFRAFLGIFNKEKFAKRRQLIMLSLFPVAPAGAGILQFIYPQLPLACAALSLSTLLMYIEWAEQVISVDPLTKLNNRKQLTYRFESWMHTHDNQDLYLMMVDANRFKHINDTYGHLEGDTALVRIADALRLGCRDYAGKSSISRYGGDEFVVLAWADRKKGEQEIRHLMESIHGHLKRLNSDANSPYDLTVCIGMAKVTEQSVLKDVIEEADAKLYDQKRR
jgi:diguanylate cyclase (GGDEF)-like protein